MHIIDSQLDCMLQGDFEQGWQYSEKMQAIGAEDLLDASGNKNPEMWLRHNFNRGWFLLRQGKFREGYELLESGRFINVYGSPVLKTSAPLYNPSEHKLEGKSIILSLEGGYGDEIIQSRYATSLKNLGAAKVYVAASPELHSIVLRIKGVDGVILRDQSNTVTHDYWVPGFSAAWICGFDYDTIPNDPYISPSFESIQAWQEYIRKSSDGKKKVGIRWSGNPKFEHQQFRRFPTDFLVNLAKHEELQVYSFQRDHNIIKLPNNIVDLQYLMISWEDTIAALSMMDIVITSCTSIAHMAAAMGKETWVITPVLPYHIWAYGAPENNKSPFYKTVTLYRQKKYGYWNETFQDLYKDLEEKFSLKHIDHPNSDVLYKRANLGCGFRQVNGYDNYDISPLCRPDKILDMNEKTWDIPDDTYVHIVAKDILEHVDDLQNVIKEMYRISCHGALWEIQVPHWRSDLFWNDPTHKQTITPATIQMFDMTKNLSNIKQQFSDSCLAIENNVDIELCDLSVQLSKQWIDIFKERNSSQEEVDHALNYYSNVAESIKMLIQVHKPARVTMQEIQEAIDAREPVTSFD